MGGGKEVTKATKREWPREEEYQGKGSRSAGGKRCPKWAAKIQQHSKDCLGLDLQRGGVTGDLIA